MPEISVDLSEARAFAKDLTEAPVKVVLNVPDVVRKGGVNIKNQMRQDLLGSSDKGFRYVAQTVDFTEKDSGFAVEVGPSKPRGALANIAYFGGVRGGGTVADPLGALEDEIPRFEKALDRLLEGLF